MTSLSVEQKFDLAILTGAFVTLYWVLYVDPLTGELLGIALGSLPVLAGLHRYVEPEQYVLQGLAGLAAVALGGAAPAAMLYGTPVGELFVGSQPFPLAFGLMLVVVIASLVGRRYLPSTTETGDTAPV